MYKVLARIEREAEPTINSNVIRDAMNHILEDSDLLDTQPINFKILKESPHVYAKMMWSFLNETEIAQIQPGGDQITDMCDTGWLKNALSENEMLNSILRRKCQRVLRSTLKLINDPTLEVHIRYQIDPTLIQQLEDIIHVTRRQLYWSKLHLEGFEMDTSICFRSETASFAATIKLFSLLPSFSLTKKFVTFDARTWRYLLSVCNAPFRHDPRDKTGYRKIEDSLDTFESTLNLKKVRLNHR
jgi:hypothetical protein